MLRFYRPAPCGGLVGSLSPYVHKVDLWLRMTGVPYEEVIGTAAELIFGAPRQLSPYIDLDEERIDDSRIIIDRLKALHNDPLNDGRLTQAQKVRGRLIKNFCEDEFFYLMAYGRFDKDTDWRSVALFNLGDTVPEEQQEEAIEAWRGLVNEKLHIWRIGRYDADFVNKELRRCLGLLSEILGYRPWLFDDAPCIHDVELCAALTQIIHFPYRCPQVEIAREYTNLVEYCDRIRETYYDYDSGAARH